MLMDSAKVVTVHLNYLERTILQEARGDWNQGVSWSNYLARSSSNLRMEQNHGFD